MAQLNSSMIIDTALVLGHRLIEALWRTLDNYEKEKDRVDIDEVTFRTYSVLGKLEIFSRIFHAPPEVEGQIIQIKYLIKTIEELHNR
jgi:hypothetical protein